MPTRIAFAVLLLCSCSLSACSKPTGPTRYPVSGNVTFDGVPVETGTIVFRDGDPKSAVAPDGGNIVKGRYSLQVQPGKKRVEILASRPIPGAAAPARADRQSFATVPVEQFIPPAYNAQSTLTAEIEPKSNDYDYDLKGTEAKK